jgi:hypothetical protein
MSRHERNLGAAARATPVVLSVGLALAATLLALTATGLAQDKKRQRAPKVVQLEEIKIEGRVQKPNAFYILNRSNIGYEVLELRTSFVQDIVRSVRREPF